MEKARLNMDDEILRIIQEVKELREEAASRGIMELKEGRQSRISRRRRGRTRSCCSKNQRIKVQGQGSSDKVYLVKDTEARALCATKERNGAVEEAVACMSLGHMTTVRFQGILVTNGRIEEGTRPIPSPACARAST